MCSDLSSQLTNNFLSKIITGDETWCFQYEPESKLQVRNEELTSLQPRKA